MPPPASSAVFLVKLQCDTAMESSTYIAPPSTALLPEKELRATVVGLVAGEDGAMHGELPGPAEDGAAECAGRVTAEGSAVDRDAAVLVVDGAAIARVVGRRGRAQAECHPRARGRSPRSGWRDTLLYPLSLPS